MAYPRGGDQLTTGRTTMPRRCNEADCEDRGTIPELWSTSAMDVVVWLCPQHHDEAAELGLHEDDR